MWKRGDTELVQGANLQLDNLSLGKYTYTLVVTDDKNAIGSDDVEVVVQAKLKTNQAPTANAGADKTITEGQSLILKGSGNDSDGQIKSYLWKSGGIELAHTANFDIKGVSVGEYVYTLIVTDDKGAIGEDSMKLLVESESVETGDITVSLSETLCRTVAGIHLKLVSTVTGGVTGKGPLYITQYAAANCTGGILPPPLPFGLPSETIASYTITNIESIEEGRRRGLMTVTALGQQRSDAVSIDSNGNVSR